MPQTYFAILTATGEAKDANAKALGIPLELTHMAVGDGNGATPVPDRTRTALVNEVRRAPLNQLSIDPQNASQIIAEQVIPENVGGWWIREIGLYDNDGDLIAIANCPPTYKPQLAEGSGRTQVVRMVLIITSAENVQLKIDPAIVLATRKYADDAITASMNAHLAAADPHPVYLTHTEGNTLIAAAVVALVNSSPAALDTLGELANALGNDPNYSATVLNLLAAKAPLDSVGSRSVAYSYSASAVIPSSQIGGLISVYGNADDVTLTTPAPNIKAGASIAFFNNSNYNVVLSTPSGNFLRHNTSGTTFTLRPYGTVEIVSDGGNWLITTGGSIRTPLFSATTFYVSPTGSDSNSGRTAAEPFATIQGAINTIFNNYDARGNFITIQLADGTYTSGGYVYGQYVGQSNGATLTIQGNVANPANVFINVTNLQCFVAKFGAWVNVRGVKLRTNTTGSGLWASYNGTITFSDVIFDACANVHIFASNGGMCIANGNYSISGTARAHIQAQNHGEVHISSHTVNITAALNFPVAFVQAYAFGLASAVGTVFTGSACTGRRYDVISLGLIDSGAAGANHFPGNSVGTIGMGGQYV